MLHFIVAYFCGDGLRISCRGCHCIIGGKLSNGLALKLRGSLQLGCSSCTHE